LTNPSSVLAKWNLHHVSGGVEFMNTSVLVEGYSETLDFIDDPSAFIFRSKILFIFLCVDFFADMFFCVLVLWRGKCTLIQ